MLHSIAKRIRQSLSSTDKSARRAKRRKAQPFQYEHLEHRQLMATLAGNNTITFQDVDGDAVLISFSKRFLTTANVNNVFQFNTGSVDGSNSLRQQLNSINLGSISAAAGTTIKTYVFRNTTSGDGKVHVGQIMAWGRDLSDVTITGDLGRILAGDANASTQGLGNLSVDSMGMLGTATGASNLNSTIQGSIARLNFSQSVRNATIRTEGGGHIGSIQLGRSLEGGSVNGSGSIQSSGMIGNVSIGGSIRGSSGNNSGFLSATSGIGNVVLGASLIGGEGNFSGNINSASTIRSVTVNGSVRGDRGISSGVIYSAGLTGAVTVTSSVFGGEGEFSGRIIAGQAGTVTIQGSVVGSSGKQSGLVLLNGDRASLTVKGNLEAGFGEYSGTVQSTSQVRTISIEGNVLGSPGRPFDSIRLNRASTINVGGYVLGATIRAAGDVTNMSTGSLLARDFGQNGLERPSRIWLNSAASLSVQGLVVGSDIRAEGSIGTLQVNGNLQNASIWALGTYQHRGRPSFYAFRSITINGQVRNSAILGGWSFQKLNPDAQIGRVVVSGNWHESTLLTGAVYRTPAGARKYAASDLPPGGDYLMSDSPSLTAKVLSIEIGGTVFGGNHAVMSDGFFAEEIGSFTLTGTRANLIGGPGNDKRFLHRQAALFEYRDYVW
jgi:hypothetical protein